MPGLPAPDLQVVLRVPWPARSLARVDFYWDEWGVVGEADGHGEVRRFDRCRPGREGASGASGTGGAARGALGLGRSRRTSAHVANRLRAAFARAQRRDRAPRDWRVVAGSPSRRLPLRERLDDLGSRSHGGRSRRGTYASKLDTVVVSSAGDAGDDDPASGGSHRLVAAHAALSGAGGARRRAADGRRASPLRPTSDRAAPAAARADRRPRAGHHRRRVRTTDAHRPAAGPRRRRLVRDTAPLRRAPGRGSLPPSRHERDRHRPSINRRRSSEHHPDARQRRQRHRLQGRRPVPGRLRPQGDRARRARDAGPDGAASRVRPDSAAQGQEGRRLAAHDDPDRRADRDARGARRGRALGQLQHLLHPGPRRRGRRRRAEGHRREPVRRAGLRLEGRDAGGVLVVHRDDAHLARRLGPGLDRRRRW